MKRGKCSINDWVSCVYGFVATALPKLKKNCLIHHRGMQRTQLTLGLGIGKENNKRSVTLKINIHLYPTAFIMQS